MNGKEVSLSHLPVKPVAYEGRGAYACRASFQQNQSDRFVFGRVYPQVFCEKENGAGACAMQTECLLLARSESPRLRITLGFLQPMIREIGASEKVLEISPENGGFRFQNVRQFKVAGKTFQAWMEAVERKISIVVHDFHAVVRTAFAFPASESRATIQNETGGVAGLIFRRDEVLEGKIESKITRLRDDLFRICARVVNLSAIEPNEIRIPEKVLLRTFTFTHFTLEAQGGEFVSLVETPRELRHLADDCKNVGCWPILANDRTMVLASPITPGNCPEIVPKMPGGLSPQPK